ncbi:hypothetical protein [Amycolatopsis sp. H20-H5]|uniref:hypothetical protein n=1 Tax=Amycolatopsis sp. H20-H5 TaxID=3046309 RepID=UPI002DBA4759|nr:hypothetical protein [Amycolatopsis sp. H20-H5]MEC3975229.1 hypothetical protein [Amycolatopsis sp. H20-H5]
MSGRKIAGGQLPDETALVLPVSWREHIHPRRGGWLRLATSVNTDAAAFLMAKLDEALPLFAGADAALLTAFRAYRAGEADPLGAAVAAQLVLRVYGDDERAGPEHIVDAWATQHGLTFAAEAAVELGRVELEAAGSKAAVNWVLRFRAPDTAFHFWVADALVARARVLLAAADDDSYDAAVEALEAHRGEHLTRMIVSFLVPTRQDWVDELCAAGTMRGGVKGDWSMLLCSLGSAKQLEKVHLTTHLREQLNYRDILYTLVDGIGTGVAPTVALLLDRHPKDRDLWGILVRLPTDEAFDLLVDRLDTKPGLPAVLAAVKDYPVRAIHRLAAAAGGNSVNAVAAGQVLRGHVQENPVLMAAVLPVLPDDLRPIVEPFTVGYGQLPEAPADALPAILHSPPWAVARPAASAVVVQGLAVPEHRALKWATGEREAWKVQVDGGLYPAFPFDDAAAAVKSYRSGSLDWYEHISLFTAGPENVVRPLLAAWRPGGQCSWDAQYWGKPLVARYGLEALPPVLHMAKAKPATAAELLLPFVTPEVASLMADWLVRLKSARPTATA